MSEGSAEAGGGPPEPPSVEVEAEADPAGVDPEGQGPEPPDAEQPAYSYDQVPYSDHAFAQTHPDRLAVIGRLYGLAPAPVERCRVLELGCGLGGNLVPMGLQMPGSEFVGVDLSRRQIEEGRRAVEAAGLGNVRLEHADIGDVDASWGRFDYIICHGVFSWVPESIREHILAVSARNLEPGGIAYVSYNTYPGWHMREMIRHMMRYHSEQFEQPRVRIGQSKALLKFMTDSLPKDGEPYARYLRQELAMLNRQEDSYLFHEHLEDVNEPVYFHQFVEQAGRHGLQYLGEADFGSMLMHGVTSAQVRRTVQRISADVVRIEQYMDFLRNRTFRQTLLCHDGGELERRIAPGAVESLLLWSTSRAMDPGIDFDPATAASFRTSTGRTVRIRRPIAKAALQLLAQRHPRGLAFGELFDMAAERVPARWRTDDREQMRSALAQDALQCFSLGALDLRTWLPELEGRVSERPRICPLAAYRAKAGKRSTVNRYHRQVPIGPVARVLAPALDGGHDRRALVEHAAALVRDGDLPISRNGRPVTDPDEVRRSIAGIVEQALNNLARSALLVG
ncbi:MAG: methyltransferase regulatory domain-containing protein [Chromatiales bacterium]